MEFGTIVAANSEKYTPKMKNILPALVLMCTMGSCVTLFNGPSTSLNVRVPDNAKVVYTNECGNTDSVAPGINNMARLIVRRSNKKLPLTVVSDTGIYSFAVKPTLSWLFWANVYPLYGLGFLVDYNNPNRFTYPHFVYPFPQDEKRYAKMKPLTRSTLEIAFIPPFIHGYCYNPTKLDFTGGVLGIGTGLNYHYNSKCFLSGEIGAATAPFFFGERFPGDSVPKFTDERISGWYLNLRHHHQFGRFDLGYGLSTGEQSGKRYYYYYRGATYENDSVIYSYRHATLGLSFATNFRITNAFYFGMNYQPQLFAINTNNRVFSYAHMWNFGIYWRWGLNPKW